MSSQNINIPNNDIHNIGYEDSHNHAQAQLLSAKSIVVKVVVQGGMYTSFPDAVVLEQSVGVASAVNFLLPLGCRRDLVVRLKLMLN